VSATMPLGASLRRCCLAAWLAVPAPFAMGGCGSDPVVAEGSARQFTFSTYATSGLARVILIVVDDEPTEQGRAVRTLLAERFFSEFERGVHLPVQSCTSTDPAVWTPYLRYAVVVSPSRALDATQASPGTDRALVIESERETPEAVAAWTSAVSQAIVEAGTDTGGAYHPLEAQAHWARLLLGREEPASETERAAIEALPAAGNLQIFLGSARDDQSPLDPEAYRILQQEGDRFFVDWPQAMTPDPTFVHCGPGHLSRLDAWALSSEVQSDLCVDHDVFDAHWVLDCFPECSDLHPLVDDTGRSRCRVLATTDPAPCDAGLGWVDPLGSDGVRRPREIDYQGTPARVCEILELEGAALESCRHDWDCADCGAGYCVTELPGTPEVCTGVNALWPIRFTNDAMTARFAYVDVVCDAERRTE
jgi:hypothetical protein